MIISEKKINWKPTHVRLNSGEYFDFINMQANKIKIEDIAWGLTFQNRFLGQLPRFLSIAEHSISVCNLCDDSNKLAGLLHDASEAYLRDVPKPLKRILPEYQRIENKLMEIISDKFGFKYPFDKQIKEIDNFLLEKEAKIFFEDRQYFYNFKKYEKEFLRLFNQHYKQ